MGQAPKDDKVKMRDETFTFVQADSFTTLPTYQGCPPRCSRTKAPNLIQPFEITYRTEVRKQSTVCSGLQISVHEVVVYERVIRNLPFLYSTYFSSHPLLLRFCSAAPFHSENRRTLQPGCISLAYSLACCCGCACLFLVSHRRPLVA